MFKALLVISLFFVSLYGHSSSTRPSSATKKSDTDVNLKLESGSGRSEVFKQLDKAKAAAEKLKNLGTVAEEKIEEVVEKRDEGVDAKALNQELDSFFTAFIYDPDNRRDPFIAPAPQLASDKTAQDNQPKGVRISSPEALKSFEITDYQVIGVMWGVSRPKAMLLDPNKRVHTVYKDDEVGKRDGYIAAIKEKGLVIVEPVIDTRKNSKKKFRTITLEVEE